MRKKTNLKTWLAISVFLAAMSCTAAGQTIYVDADASAGGNGQTWGTAYKYLQDALYKPPASGDEIWVAEGTYKPDQDEGGNVALADRMATFQLINGVAIYGGYAGIGAADPNARDVEAYETILGGDLNEDDVGFTNNGDNSYHVVMGSNTEPNVVLDGFTITAGNANSVMGGQGMGGGMINFESSPTVTNCTFSGNLAIFGGGMVNWAGSNPMLTDCNFSANGALLDGGGMFNHSSNPTVTNCTFSGNSGWEGGGMYNDSNSSPTLTNCIFSSNSAQGDLGSGGGMYNRYSSHPTLTSCTFTGNSSRNFGGGMVNTGVPSRGFSNPTVTNCTFSDNSADYSGGGMWNNRSSPMLTNCTFSGNWAGRFGGGMCNLESSPTLTNCTLTGNFVPTGLPVSTWGGGMTNAQSSSPALKNCILWDNTAQTGPQIYNDETSSATVSYSDVQGGWPGTENIHKDPLFVDPNGPDGKIGTKDDNLRLSPGSPCIDVGDPNYYDANYPTDLASYNRYVDGDCNGTEIVDMGAYEFDWVNIGDFDAECDVDFVDYAFLALTWLLEDGDIGYNPDCDISLLADNEIDWADLKIFCDNWLAGL